MVERVHLMKWHRFSYSLRHSLSINEWTFLIFGYSLSIDERTFLVFLRYSFSIVNPFHFNLFIYQRIALYMHSLFIDCSKDNPQYDDMSRSLLHAELNIYWTSSLLNGIARSS